MLDDNKSIESAPPPSTLPILDDSVQHSEGQIAIGEIGPIAYAAVTSDPHIVFAALQHSEDESQTQLLRQREEAKPRQVGPGMGRT